MEVHSPIVAKRLWNVSRISFFIRRKSVFSKRKMIMSMNLLMKKGKVLRKSLSKFMSSRNYHNHHSSKNYGGGFMVHDYEFSCSNSPNPLFINKLKRKHHFTFPCINAPEVIDEEILPCQYLLSPLNFEIENVSKGSMTMVPKTPEYTLDFRFDASEEGESPLLSPFSVRISNYSTLEENEEIENSQVDDEAEDFIRRFYEQLRMQNGLQNCLNFKK
ncbi:uncharacterized protein LOC123888085 [Trifolium pratense]|uniref:Uncharacterized protein n=1 Tax=Trifolium pratense TaxID=57577 RepID=A0ACB0LV32_TRIPR|nr:uncharacterized protein LOC123888085 [Trifolium pratense]CAJ2672213.1 unnamed protein product [Trifolium pratense]